MQVAQGGQHLDRVRERVRHRHRAAGGPRVDQDLLERLAADVLHHDVAGRLARPPVRVLDEVVDPHDVRVLDLGQELALGHGRGHRVRVAGVQQALEHHPAVADVVVPGQVDPAEPAVREAAEHLVLPGHQVAGLQLRAEREPGPAVPAEALGQPRAARPCPGRPAGRSRCSTACSPAPAGRPAPRWPGRGRAPAGSRPGPPRAAPADRPRSGAISNASCGSPRAARCSRCPGPGRGPGGASGRA